MTAEVTRLLSKVFWIDQNMYPEMLGHTCVINAPSVFKYAWSMVKPMLDIRTQNKVEVRAPARPKAQPQSQAQPNAQVVVI